ncbi:MAG: hypothetical protein A2V93_06490 [Ignavibacteria bacterium RBG_16_34_14]|nr:MAG: hypothetical protein A2V93_06490 [Ignavibacteria bacterium RBG_16_34_14]
MVNIKEFKRITNELGRNLIRDGIIKTENKSKEQIKNEINDYIQKNLATTDLEVSIDHKESLLRNAKKFCKEKDYHSSIVFYALWMEHWLNQMILIALKRKKIDEEYYKVIMRVTNSKSKYTWLWKLLDYPPLNTNHLKIIEKLFEIRGSFIHYKWVSYKVKEAKKLIDQLKEIKSFANSIDKTIIYLKNFEYKHIYKKHKKIF